MSVKAAYLCHACGTRFTATVSNSYGTYEFRRCPNCDSAKTTLDPDATTAVGDGE